jgi:chemotaxis protein CheC
MQTYAITESDLEQLSEVFNKCVSTRTVESLSTMLGEPFDYKIGKTKLLDISELDELTPAFSDSVDMSAVYLKQTGDVDVGILYYMPEKDGKRFAAKLLGLKKMGVFSKLSKSSLSETGNILSGSFFNALAIEKHCKTTSDIPGFAIDTFRSLLEIPATDIGIETQSLIACDAEFNSQSDLRLRMLIILDPINAKKLLDMHN